MKKRRTLIDACEAFGLPLDTPRWLTFCEHICKPPVNIQNLVRAESYIPTNEYIIFLRRLRFGLSHVNFTKYINASNISFHRSPGIATVCALGELHPALIRLNYPIEHLPQMSHLWLNWKPETHTKLPKRLCQQVKYLLWVVRYLPKDLRIRMTRTFVLMDYPFKNVGTVTDTSIVQTKEELEAYAWHTKKWQYFDSAFRHKHEVIYLFLTENRLERMYKQLNMTFEDLQLDSFDDEDYRQILSIAYKFGYIGHIYRSQWFYWTKETHLTAYNDAFRRETKMILLIFKAFPKYVQLRMINFLSQLYGHENRLNTDFDFNDMTKTEVHELFPHHSRPPYKSKTKAELVRMFLKQQSFRNLLE